MPSPYPDEIMGSVIARGCVHTGLPPKRMLENIYQSSRSYCSFLMPSSFHRLGLLTGKSPDQILDEHTVFPYSVAFMPKEERERLRKKALELNVQTDCLGSLTKSVTYGVPFRRVCPQCITEDLNTYGETYWHRSHMLPAVHICAQHGVRLHETDMRLKRNLNKSFIHFPTPFGHKSISDIAPSFILQAVTEVSIAALKAVTPLEMDWHYVYRTKSLEKGYRIEGGAVASRVLTADILRFYGEKFLKDCGAQFMEGAAGPWPSLMSREGSGIPFAPVKHVLMQIFLNAESSQTLNVTGSYSRPGPRSGDSVALDTKAAKALQRELQKATRNGVRLTVQALLRTIGIWEKFRHHREKFPKTNALVQAFKASDQSERQLGRRKRLYNKPT
nr:TnsD family Tn7-like transposition protein [Rhodoferax sp. OV413]